MISPTGKSIREDSEGSGAYGAPRGTRLHNGIDYECTPGQDVIAPFDMIITGEAYPYPDMRMNGISWQKGKSRGFMFYFEVDKALIGKPVKEGQIIGTAQCVSKYYKLDKMKDHIHFQINK